VSSKMTHVWQRKRLCYLCQTSEDIGLQAMESISLFGHCNFGRSIHSRFLSSAPVQGREEGSLSPSL
jgi:hypothetical protein